MTLFHGWEASVRYRFVWEKERVCDGTGTVLCEKSSSVCASTVSESDVRESDACCEDEHSVLHTHGVGACYLQCPGFLVKTPCVDVAVTNARRRDVYAPRVCVVHYPAGSQQLHCNVRFKDSEFEHFTHDNERLRVLCVRRVWQGCVCVTYYICEPA